MSASRPLYFSAFLFRWRACALQLLFHGGCSRTGHKLERLGDISTELFWVGRGDLVHGGGGGGGADATAVAVQQRGMG